MRVQVSLFGVFRSFDPGAQVVLDVPDGARVTELRQALEQYGNAHWPGFNPALLRRSAFASETNVLREADALPADGRMAVLPPVSGG